MEAALCTYSAYIELHVYTDSTIFHEVLNPSDLIAQSNSGHLIMKAKKSIRFLNISLFA